MSTIKSELHCLSCEKSECETPQKLAGKLEKVEQLTPAQHHKH